jgi:hypothetical protein
VDHGEERQLLAKERSFMQQWHGGKENSSEKVGPRTVVGRLPEEGVPPCNSGMAKEEQHQENSDPGKQ